LGSIFALLSLAGFSLFAYGAFYRCANCLLRRRRRASAKKRRIRIADQNGKQVALADLLSGKAALLIFYRGHW
jgi:hypothetical protein